MTRHSLRARLTLAAAVSIALALSVAGIGLVTLFERHVERRIGSELDAQLSRLAAATSLAADGSPQVDPTPADPRFHAPLSGLYWQVDDPGSRPATLGRLRSRSLWDTIIRLPPDRLDPGAVHAHTLPGPGGQELMVRERLIVLEGPGGPRGLRLMVAVDRAELTQARDAFAADMLPYLVLIALLLGVAALVQIRTGLAPLEAVRRGVGAVRSGDASRLAETYPDEVMPLVTEVNALLTAREQTLQRARAWTADLAHGLKTPLAALAADADRLRGLGNPELAAELEQLAQTMRRRVDRELVRARVRSGAADARVSADLIHALQGVLGTLRRTPGGGRLEWMLEGPDSVGVAMLEDDLHELLGNLLENAAKWARARVRVEVQAGERVDLRIADDGPGVPAAELSRLGERGLRLDESKDGSGLGLAIVRDIADAYGADLSFGAASEGGLAVTVALPGAPGRFSPQGPRT